MSKDNSDLVLFIGEYQLKNLQANNVNFSFFDLRSSIDQVAEKTSSNEGMNSHLASLLRGSMSAAPDLILQKLEKQSVAKNDPIVLICEDGVKSFSLAIKLAQNDFINVFVLKGGVAALRDLN